MSERIEPEYGDDVHQDWIEKIQSEGRDLTEWERDFVESLSRRRVVSRKQEKILERIYVDKTPS